MINFTVEKKDLGDALKLLSGTVGTNKYGVDDDCIIMEITNNQSTLTLYTTNTMEFGIVDIPIGICSAFGNVPIVNFNRFKKIIDTIKDGVVLCLESNAAETELYIYENGSTHKPITLSANNTTPFPRPAVSNIISTVNIPRVILMEALNYSSSIIEDSDSTPIFNCMRLGINGAAGGHPEYDFSAIDQIKGRAYSYTMIDQNTTLTQDENVDILLEVNKLKKILSNPAVSEYKEITIETDGNIIYIEPSNPGTLSTALSDIKFCTRRLSGTFPANISSSLANIDKGNFACVYIDDIMRSISRAAAIEDHDNSQRAITMANVGTELHVNVSSTFGDLKDVIDIRNAAALPADASLNGVYQYKGISDIINSIQKVSRDDKICIHTITGHVNHLIVKPETTDVYFMISALVSA